jgi:hypothetical protein
VPQFEISPGWQKADVHRMLGSAVRALGNTNAAIEEFYAAIAIDPSIDKLCALLRCRIGGERS